MKTEKESRLTVTAVKSAKIVVSTTIYNIVRTRAFSNQFPLKSSRLGGLI